MKKLLKKAFAKFGYEVKGARSGPKHLLDPALVLTPTFDDAVCRRMIERGPTLRFIQVGGFDGVMNDPLRKYIKEQGWRGVILEPQARAFEALRELYRDQERVLLMQAALDSKTGTRNLFTVVCDDAPPWAAGLASFDRDTILKHRDLLPGLEAMIREETVECVTFEQVREAVGPGDLDVLQVDTEGADAKVLFLFPFAEVRPAIVHFEVKHLSIGDRERCLDLLARHGYRFAPSGSEDMLAVHQETTRAEA